MLLIFPINCAGCSKWDLSICSDCAKAINKSPFLSNRFPVWVANLYNLPIRPIILQWKDHGRSDLDSVLEKRITHCFQTANFLQNANQILIVPIPSSKKMVKSRGFCQTALLANALENRFSGIQSKELLIKKGNAASHKLANKSSRSAEFSFNEKIKCDTLYPVVLVDDVLTTGGTWEKCKSVLEEKGFSVLGGVVIAEAA